MTSRAFPCGGAGKLIKNIEPSRPVEKLVKTAINTFIGHVYLRSKHLAPASTKGRFISLLQTILAAYICRFSIHWENAACKAMSDSFDDTQSYTHPAVEQPPNPLIFLDSQALLVEDVDEEVNSFLRCWRYSRHLVFAY
jgi:hypothetical protein